MLMPKRVKRRKQFRGSMAGKASRGNTLAYGEFGLVATEPCWIKSNQPVLRLPVIPSVPVKYGLRFSPISP